MLTSLAVIIAVPAAGKGNLATSKSVWTGVRADVIYMGLHLKSRLDSRQFWLEQYGIRVFARYPQRSMGYGKSL